MSQKRIEGSVALVTGANRGIGHAIVNELLRRGATKVYAAARRAEDLVALTEANPNRVIPVVLDVTREDQVAAVVEAASDIDLLINNAGVALGGWLGDEALIDNARHEMEVNFFGPLRLLEGFLPVLEGRPGATVVNLSSVAGLTNFPAFVTYSASKAAIHSLTQASRMLLGARGISAVGVYPGPVDTDMAREIPMDKASPQSVAAQIVDGIAAGEEDIFPDPFAEEFAQVFESSPKTSERQFAAMAAEGAAEGAAA